MMALSAPIAVDSFFFMSGLLMTWSILRELQKKYVQRRTCNGLQFFSNYHISSDGRLSYALVYFHRYLRLTPLLLVCVAVSMTIFRYFGSGPLWPLYRLAVEDNCRKYWWSTLLYIQNYWNPDDMVRKRMILLFIYYLRKNTD